jgi:hypothetical protein
LSQGQERISTLSALKGLRQMSDACIEWFSKRNSHYMQTFTRLVASLCAVILLGGCAGESLNPPSGRIGGISAAQSKVILTRETLVRMRGNVDYVYPAGEYRPAYQDAAGLYFEAPSKVIMKENFLGLHLPGKPMTGGIFLDRQNPTVAKIYAVNPENEGGEIQRMMKGGRPNPPLAPLEPIKFELKRL